jgi:hypothetical protein
LALKKVEPLQNAFAGRAKRPTGKALKSALGGTYSIWQQLVSDLKHELQLDGEDWHSSSVRYGWALRLQKKKRNIVYLAPRAGSFMAAFALSDKAIAAARKSELPAHVLKILADARRYAEGTAVRIEVRGSEDVNAVKILANIKAEVF